MLNSPFLMDRARAASERLLDDPAIPDDAIVDRAFLVALSRPPHPPERERVLNELRKPVDAGSNPSEARIESWSRVFQALFASIDFRYLD
jgi:hypothetical protein